MDDLKASDIFSVDGAPEITNKPEPEAAVTETAPVSDGKKPAGQDTQEAELLQEGQTEAPVQTASAPAGRENLQAPAEKHKDQKEDTQEEKTDEPAAVTASRRSHPLFYMFAGAVLIVLVVMGALFVRGNRNKEEIDLSGYIVFTAQGNDGAGSVSVSLDEDRFVSDYERKIQINRDRYLKAGFSESDLESKTPALILAQYLESSLQAEADQGKLTNGDSAAALVTADAAVLGDIYNVTLKTAEIPYVVSGLNKLTSFDPFAGVSLTYSGVSPEASAKISRSGQAAADNIPMKLSKSSGISKGDIITVTLDVDDPVQYCVANIGKTPLRTSMTFRADEADVWLSDAAELTGADLAAVKSDAARAAEKEIQEDTGDDSATADISYEGYYLFSGSSSADTKNILYVILEVKAGTGLTGDDLTDDTWYACVVYNNVTVTKDGIRYSDPQLEGDNLFVTAAGSDLTTAHVVGYRTALQVRKEMLLKESSDYTVTTDFDLSADTLNLEAG